MAAEPGILTPECKSVNAGRRWFSATAGINDARGANGFAPSAQGSNGITTRHPLNGIAAHFWGPIWQSAPRKGILAVMDASPSSTPVPRLSTSQNIAFAILAALVVYLVAFHDPVSPVDVAWKLGWLACIWFARPAARWLRNRRA